MLAQPKRRKKCRVIQATKDAGCANKRGYIAALYTAEAATGGVLNFNFFKLNFITFLTLLAAFPFLPIINFQSPEAVARRCSVKAGLQLY